MSAAFTLVAAAALQCYLNRPTDGSVPGDSIPAMTVSISDAMAESLAAQQPPENPNRFVGESGLTREWVLGQPNPVTKTLKLLRVELAGTRSLPSPFAARYGTVSQAADGPRFDTELSGYCTLRAKNGVSK